jgi:His/Glu/Gln/Arg/opine family amino acid ABC transporter permease subunit
VLAPRPGDGQALAAALLATGSPVNRCLPSGLSPPRDYQIIFNAVRKGVWTTIYVSIVAYALATLMGLVWCLMRVSQSRWMQEISSFFVEMLRGIPMLVLLLYIAFVGAPALVICELGGRPLIDAGIMDEAQCPPG